MGTVRAPTIRAFWQKKSKHFVWMAAAFLRSERRDSPAHAQRSNGAATAVMASRGSPRDAPSNAHTMHILLLHILFWHSTIMGTGLHAAVSAVAVEIFHTREPPDADTAAG